MVFTNKNQTDIINDLLLSVLENVSEITDANIGSVFRQHMEAIGIEIKNLYDELDEIYEGTRISTATGTDLDEIGLLVGKTRDEGNKSSGYITAIRTSPASTDFTINTSVIVSTQPNTGEEQLKFSVSAATTFLSSISDEQHTFVGGNWYYKLNERFVSNTTGVEITGNTTSTSIIYTFDNGTDFIISEDYDDFLIDVDTIVNIDPCEATTGWSASTDATAIALDNTYYKQSAGSLKLGKNGTTSTIAYYEKTYDTAIDGTNLWFNMYFRCVDATAQGKINKIEVYLCSGGSTANSYKFSLNGTDLTAADWKRFRWQYNSTTTETTGNPDISSINFIKVRIITNNNTDLLTSGDINMDYMIFSDTESYKGDVVKWLETTSPISSTIFYVDYIPLSKEVPVESEAIGNKYNVNAGKITTQVTKIPNVNSIYNYSALTLGEDEETDDDFRTRIQNASEGQGRATVEALRQAALDIDGVSSVNIEDQPLVTVTDEVHYYTSSIDTYYLNHEVIYHDDTPPTNITITGTASGRPATLTYGTDYESILNSDRVRLSAIQWESGGTAPDNGTAFYVDYQYNWLGHVYIYVSSSGGTPTTTLIETVENTLEEIKAAGITLHILSPTTIYVAVTATILPDTDYTFAQIEENVESAIYEYLNNLDIGQDVYLAKIYDVMMGVTGVKNINISNITTDTTISTSEIARPGTITLSEMS